MAKAAQEGTLNVRLAVLKDAAVLGELCAVVHALHVRHRPDFFRPVSAAELGEWFEHTLAEPRVRVWLAEEQGVGLGYVLVWQHERAETPFLFARRWCDLDQLSVLPEHRQRGVARALIAAAVAGARADGFEQVDVSCWAFNDVAQSVFRRLGFSPKVVRLELPRAGG